MHYFLFAMIDNLALPVIKSPVSVRIPQVILSKALDNATIITKLIRQPGKIIVIVNFYLS